VGKYKDLLKNIGMLTISSFGSKILIFLLIPLYTNFLSAEEYGTFDLYLTSVTLLVPLLTENISEAVVRFTLDQKTNNAEIFTIAMKKVFSAVAVITVLVGINHVFVIIPMFTSYSVYFILLFSTTLLYTLLSQFARGLGKFAIISVGGVINAITMLLFNILFLVYFKQGLSGYFEAYILSYLLPSIFFAFKLRIWEYISWGKFNNRADDDMKSYGKPLIADSISWWIINASDRYIVTWLCGVAINGIYSVAYKIPSVLNVFQDIFNKAWVVSAITNVDNEAGFYSQTYNMYNMSMSIMCSIMILLNQVIANILFANDFYAAWQYAPFLMISTIIGGVSSMIGGIFLAYRETKIMAQTSMYCAILNIFLNFVLVYFYGALGAAISTVASYLLSWIMRLTAIKKYVYLDINSKRDLIVYTLLLFQSFVWLSSLKLVTKYVVQLCVLGMIVISFVKEIKKVVCQLVNF